MRKIKILFLTFIILILCGCDINYKLDITNNKYKTNINIKEIKNDYTTNFLNSIKENLYATNTRKYVLKNNSDNEQININLSDEKTLNEFRDSSEFKDYFENAVLVDDEEFVYIYAENFLFENDSTEEYKINNLSISITSNHKIKSQNATEVKNNTYTWKGGNNTFPNIEFIYYKNELINGDKINFKEEVKKDPNEKINTIIMVAIGIIIFIIALAAIISVNNNYKKRSK